MAAFNLDAIKVAKPCPADWDAMEGDDRVRFCGICRLNVYDLSEMTNDEATALITKSEGRVCARFYRRKKDGKVLTSDCPSGVRTARRRAAGVAAGIAAAAGLAGGLFQGLRGRALPVATVVTTSGTPEMTPPLTPTLEPEEPEVMMGRVAAPEPEPPVEPAEPEPPEHRELIMGDITAPRDNQSETTPR